MIIFLLYFFLFIYLLKKWSFFSSEHISRRFLIFVFVTKILIGLSLFWVYTEYYPNKSMINKDESRKNSDIFKYYDDSEVIYNALHEKPIDFFKIIFSVKNNNEYFYENYYINMNHWDTPYDTNIFNDSHTITRLNALIRIFSYGNYFVHVLFFCMLSIIGLFALFKSITNFFPKKEKILKWMIFFTPSILFWSSGVLKEPILLFSLGMAMLSIYNLINKKRLILNLGLLILMSIIMFYIKFYVFFVFIPLIIPFAINQLKNYKYPLITYLISLSAFIILSINLKHFSNSSDLLYILDKKQESFMSETKFKDAGSYFEINDLQPNYVSVFNAIPEGLLNCFTKPLPWQINSIIELPPAIENSLIICLILISVFHCILLKTYKSISSSNFLIFCILFALFNFIIIGISTPVYGALIRYKIIGLLFILMPLILLTDFKSIINKNN